MKRTKQQPKAVGTIVPAKLAARIAALGSKCSYEYVEVFITAMEHHRGDATPVEQFLYEVCMLYSIGKLTPEEVADEVETFKERFHYMVQDSRYFVQQNPTLFQDLLSQPAAKPGSAEAA